MSRAARHRSIAYTVSSEKIDGRFHPVARALCTGRGCTNLKSIRLQAGEGNNPEFVQKKFRNDGWEFDAWNASSVRCPDCLNKRAEARRGESPKGNVVTLAASQHPTARPVSAAPAATGGGVAAPVAAAPIPAPSPGASLALAPNKTALTVVERTKLRAFLDGVFDADKGFYVLDYSDAKVAAEHGLPAKLVADFRDMAFGPIKSVPELEALRLEMEKIAEDSRKLVKDATAIDALARELRRRIDETAKRLGVAT